MGGGGGEIKRQTDRMGEGGRGKMIFSLRGLRTAMAVAGDTQNESGFNMASAATSNSS